LLRVLASALPWVAGAWMALIALDSLAGEAPARQLAAVVLAAASGAVLQWRRTNPEAVAIASLVLAVPYHALVPEAVIPISAMFALWAVTLARPPRVSLGFLAGVLVVSSLNFVTGSVDDTMFTFALAVSVWALAEGIRVVARGDALLAATVTRRLLDRFAPTLPDPRGRTGHAPHHQLLDQLTERETEVLHLVATARSNSEIAEQLDVSEATVKTHVSALLRKLGLRDRVQAVVFAYQTGIITPGTSTR
jgi:DNA-binding CsgD family transcriptional regulator